MCGHWQGALSAFCSLPQDAVSVTTSPSFASPGGCPALGSAHYQSPRLAWSPPRSPLSSGSVPVKGVKGGQLV